MVSDPVAADREPETVQALRDAAKGFNGRIRVDSNVPYAEVKAAWERAAVGMVLTTGPEPFGRTALEALASGAALITSGRGGLAEICGPCAVTVEPSDADGVAAALGQLMDEPERRAELARAGRKRVEQLFDIRTVARQMDEFIEACLGAGAEKRTLRRLRSGGRSVSLAVACDRRVSLRSVRIPRPDFPPRNARSTQLPSKAQRITGLSAWGANES